MSQQFIRSTNIRALDEELRRLRAQLASSQSTGTESALLATVQALAARVASLEILLTQVASGAVRLRVVGGTDEETIQYIEVDDNDFNVSGTGQTRRLDLGVGTTKGDLIAWNATPQPERLPVGADNAHLVADSAQATGLKWLAATGTYTPTNVTPDRSFDADTVLIEELADVVGTLIADLQAQGIIG